MSVTTPYTKSYTRINWKNGTESKSTALDKINLNKMDGAIDILDTRVAALDASKADEADVLQMVKDVSMDPSYTITVTKKMAIRLRSILAVRISQSCADRYRLPHQALPRRHPALGRRGNTG